MKRIALIVASAAFIAAGAQAQDTGWYVRGDLGGNFDTKLKLDPDLTTDGGLLVGGGAGYKFDNGLRAEGELTYMQNDLEDSSDGETKALAGFGNIIYDFNRDGRWQPFVGAGLGFAQVKLENGAFDEEDTAFAYQAKAGVSYVFNDRLTGEVAYRYIGVSELEFDSGASTLEGDFDSQAITFGLRYKFGS